MKNTSTCVIVSTIPKMKLVIFRAIYSNNKTTLLMPLPNFAVMIKQKFFPRLRNPIHIMHTQLVWLKTAIFGAFAPPWTILRVSSFSLIILACKCFLKLTILLSGPATTSAHPPGVKAQAIFTILQSMRHFRRFMSE